jgi:hypothetical protein
VVIVGPTVGGVLAAVLYSKFVSKGEPPAVEQEPRAQHALGGHAAR